MGKSLRKAFFMRCAEYAILFLIWVIFLTCRKSWDGKAISNRACVVLFWHGKLAMMPFVFKKWWNNKAAKVIISDHKDGEIITRVISHFGIGAIRGSSSKGAARALIEAFREIKNGTDVIITPDGPRGPKFSISDGSVIIAQKMDCEVVILDYKASAFWQFKSWDAMILPKPFSHIAYSISKPFSLHGLEINAAKALLANKLKYF